MATPMTVQCPSCDSSFPVDPAKVPTGGVRTQCTVCDTFFRVDRPGSLASTPSHPEPSAVSTEADDWGIEEPFAEDAPAAVAGAAEAGAGGFDAFDATQGDEPADVELEEVLDFTVETGEPLASMESGEPTDGGAAFATEADAGAAVHEEWSTALEDEWILERDEDETSSAALEVDPEPMPGLEELGSQDFEIIEGVAGGDPEAGIEVEVDGVSGSEFVLDSAPSEEPEVLSADASSAPSDPEAVAQAPAPADVTPAAASTTGFQFGRRDPHEKARRLARVLVSDMITYNPDRHTQALASGSLAQEFAEEMEKSWAEYVDQVGQEIAQSTSYWRDALNEILAKGKPLF